MMTHELEVSILAAPLEAIDRRMLSQAWYSALHLAGPARHSAAKLTAQRPWPMRPAERRHVMRLAPNAQKPELNSPRTLHAIRGAAHPGEVAMLRRSSHSSLAARIERAFAAASLPKRATFSLGRGNARVHVVLQTTPARAMLVALCRPELRADVGQALAQARTALAARGIALDVRKLGGRACS